MVPNLTLLRCAAATLLACTGPAAAGQYSFAQVLPPGATYAAALAINDAGQVVGQTETGSGPLQGFALAGGAYATVPQVASLAAINRHGVAVGLAPAGGTADRIDSYNLATGKLTTLPITKRRDLAPVAISDSGVVAGIFLNAAGAERGFLLSGSTLTIPQGPAGTNATSLAALDDNGDAVGGLRAGRSGMTHGFRYTGGQLTPYDPPGSDFTQFTFVDSPTVSGGTYSKADGTSSGFVLDGSTLTNIDFPGAASTSLVARKSASGIEAGNFTDAQGMGHGFVRWDRIYHQIDVPGADTTTVLGVNNAGDLVGSYFVRGTGTYGFLATCAPSQAPCTQ